MFSQHTRQDASSAKTPTIPLSQRTLRTPVSALTSDEVQIIHILVMGLTGAGKSTFIKILTGDNNIKTGNGLRGVTEEVAEYIYLHRKNGIDYEVHLIDTPGFNDGQTNDPNVLKKIARWINAVYKLGQTVAGVIYIHDITNTRMGATGERNLRMLEEMVGQTKFENITLVTNKWNCSADHAGELIREGELEADSDYWSKMRAGDRKAGMKRFLKSKASALEILDPHLNKSFAPELCIQMDPKQGNRPLGKTDAGRVVWDDLEARLAAEGRLEEVEKAKKYYRERFDEKLFDDYLRDRDRLIREHQIHRVGRWTIRTVILGGCITATVFTYGAAAASFTLVPGFETVAHHQKTQEREQKLALQDRFKKAAAGSELFKDIDEGWLTDKKVKDLKDLDSYSLKNRSSTEIDNPKWLDSYSTKSRSSTELDMEKSDN